MLDPLSVRQNRLLAELSLADLELILPHLSNIRLDKGAVLQDVQSPVDRVWFPFAGHISLLTPMRNGASVETAMVGREGAVNAFAGPRLSRTPTQAIVLRTGSGVAIAASRFGNAVRQSEELRDCIIRYNDSIRAQL